MSIENIDVLIDDGLVLVLGAGASMDYGFPNWDNLQPLLISSLRKEISTGNDENRQRAIKWKKVIEAANFAESTIDQVISNNFGNMVDRHWVAAQIKQIISDCEKSDFETERSGTWIHQLSNHFASLWASGLSDERVVEMLGKFKVVTLNYDRCFEYHFFEKLQVFLNTHEFSDRRFLATHEQVLRNFFRTFHPHGSLGFLSLQRGSRMGNPITAANIYDGNLHNYQKSNSAGLEYGGRPNRHNHIELVGEGDMNENYRRLNDEYLQEHKNCLIIGLSHLGLLGCKINWEMFDQVFYTEATVPSRINGNFQTLDLYADPLMKKILK